MGKGRNVYRVLVGKPEGKVHLKDQGVDGWDQNGPYGDWLGGGGAGFVWLRIGIADGLSQKR
jgi:hypothetical protein